MQQARLDDDWTPAPARTAPGIKAIPVVVGEVTSRVVDQPADLRDAVCRYLRDQTATAISRHGTFLLVDAAAPADLLAGFGIPSPSPAPAQTAAPEAAFDVEIIRLEEQLGATFKVGVYSSQKKHAVAVVKITLRSLTGGANLASVQQGRSSKGAWGVIATVNREAMKSGRKEWKLDGSMIGLACAEAVRAGVEDLEMQTLFRAKALGAEKEMRLSKTKTERGR